MTPQSDLLRIEDLGISFALQGYEVDAVRSAYLRVLPGKVTALVGESGSGKSVIAKAVMGILPKHGGITKGRKVFNDTEGGGKKVDFGKLGPGGAGYRTGERWGGQVGRARLSGVQYKR